jgi:3-dehydroquinate dehydratase type I
VATPKISKIPSLIQKAEERGADFLEIRLDYLQNVKGLSNVVENAAIPLIATNRQYEQGGKRKQTEAERIDVLINAATIGFTYVDVELTTHKIDSVIEELEDVGIKPIVSFHDFEKTGKKERLRDMVQSQINVGAGICKLVTTANSLSDNLTCLSLVSEMKNQVQIICFAMGEIGQLSRALSPLFGAYFTYAALEKGLETASGQISIQKLRRWYGLLGLEKWRSMEKQKYAY